MKELLDRLKKNELPPDSLFKRLMMDFFADYIKTKEELLRVKYQLKIHLIHHIK